MCICVITYVYVYIYTHACVCIYIQVCLCIRMYKRTNMCVYIICIHIYNVGSDEVVKSGAPCQKEPAYALPAFNEQALMYGWAKTE